MCSQVYQSLTECDEEIAEYARNNRVFAILGQDSDYVIMDTGNTLYLSIEHLNLRNMTTRLYDRWELARSLRLHPSQLPLLATFMGNDIITAQDLRNPDYGAITGGARRDSAITLSTRPLDFDLCLRMGRMVNIILITNKNQIADGGLLGRWHFSLRYGTADYSAVGTSRSDMRRRITRPLALKGLSPSAM
ncbi:hypothetical protein J6590_028404 [Homalodisca vitripennis]|nr:hypothetical protein J6590_028404 [Homalodisca vitripennis]